MEQPLVKSSTPPANQVPNKALWMVMLTVFMDTFANNVLVPMLAPYAKKDFEASNSQIGLLFSCPCASAFAFSYVLPRLTHWLGRKPVFVMSLLGMSMAALCQGLAATYEMLLLGRTFGGLWIGTIATAKVYVNEVTEWDSTGNDRSYWFAQMSLCQNVGKMFAPGLGGALTHYGLNVPSLITSLVELVGAGIVYINVVESPKFCNVPGNKEIGNAAGQTTGAARGTQTAVARWRLLQFCLASMVTTACMKLTQTVFALYAMQAYGLKAIDIGFIFLLGALATILATRLVVQLNNWIGPYNSSIFCSTVHALSTAALPMCHLSSSSSSVLLQRIGLLCMVLCFVIAAAASTLANTFQSIISGELEDQPTVQGRGFQFRQGGQIVVPMLASYLFNVNMSYPWFLGALLAGAAAIPCALLKPREASRERQNSGFGDEWVDETLTKQQIVELGEFMAVLLRQKHLKWASHREQVACLLERSVPEMPIHSREDYYEALVQYAS